MQLYVHLTHKNVVHHFDRLKSCLDYVKKWLSANKLKLNSDKTLFLVQKYVKNSTNLNILGNFLSPVGVVRNLGVWFDSDLPFLRHVQDILFC